jgi:hypothetical protein
MNKKIIVGIVGVAVASGLFYGGIVYGKSRSSNRGQFANAQFAGMRMISGRGGGNDSGFVSGEIISKDVNGVTIKMLDGSTKIILIGEGVQVAKSTVGSVSDLVDGINISINGTPNSDGSITAQSVQIRPAGAQPVQIRINQ